MPKIKEIEGALIEIQKYLHWHNGEWCFTPKKYMEYMSIRGEKELCINMEKVRHALEEVDKDLYPEEYTCDEMVDERTRRALAIVKAFPVAVKEKCEHGGEHKNGICLECGDEC